MTAALWWTLTLGLMLAGFIGTVVPVLPGTTVILAAAIMHHLALGEARSIGWWGIAGLVALTVLSYAVDFGSAALGAKHFGATRWGAVGGLLGTVVGMFFFPLGIFLGPIIGVLLGELIGGQGLLPAGKSTWGTFLGTTAGLVGKLTIAGAMIAWFLVAALVR